MFQKIWGPSHGLWKICEGFADDLLYGLHAYSAISRAEEDLDAGSLHIMSETVKYSAKIHIKEEEGGQISDKEKEEDKMRKELGIGERVKLTLEGKPDLIGDVSKISWSIKEGDDLGSFRTQVTGTKTVLLDIKQDLKKAGNLKVEVVVESEEKREIQFSVVVPTGMEAKHQRRSYDRNSPDFNKRGVSFVSPDGDMVNAGASAILEVTVLPVTVNFSNIEIIERDMGTLPPPGEGRLASTHKPMLNPAPLTEHNRVFDSIGGKRSLEELVNYILPQEWIWMCSWRTHVDGEDVLSIQTVGQRFHYSWISMVGFVAAVTISKFDCSVTRSTEAHNKHVFIPEK